MVPFHVLSQLLNSHVICLLQAQKPSMHNMNGLFRIIVTLDAGTNKLMNEDAVKLIAGYLVDASLVCNFPNFRALIAISVCLPYFAPRHSISFKSPKGWLC